MATYGDEENSLDALIPQDQLRRIIGSSSRSTAAASASSANKDAAVPSSGFKPQKKHLVAEAKLRGLNVTFRGAQDYIDWLAGNPRLSGEDSTHQQAEQTLSVVSMDKNGETTKERERRCPQ